MLNRVEKALNAMLIALVEDASRVLRITGISLNSTNISFPKPCKNLIYIVGFLRDGYG